MSLRVGRVEPVCSTKSSTQKQYDPLRFWRAQLAKQNAEKQSQPAKSFYDVLTISVEGREAARKLSEAKK